MMYTNRIMEEFMLFTSFDSVSFSERKTADHILERLKSMGFETKEDDAGQIYSGNAGNLYGFLKGTLPGTPVLLSAHMDVVCPGKGKKAIVHEDGKITSGGDTVLGSDDICGIVEILHGIEYVLQKGLPHRDIEVLFSIGEEVYCKGTAVFDYSKIRAKEAYVLDLSGAVGTAAIQAPSIISFEIEIKGKAAHAGFEPESGIHAISAMSEFIMEIRQGHIDKDTTLNIGTVSGGTASNIVPEGCLCTGEIRSYRHDRALQCLEELKDILEKTAAKTGTEYTMRSEVHIQAYKIEDNAEVLRIFKEACAELGISGKIVSTFGGSDNNNLVLNGIQGIVLSCGMNKVHSLEEYTTIEDLEKGAELVSHIICSRKSGKN